jgi:hypothetical protein
MPVLRAALYDEPSRRFISTAQYRRPAATAAGRLGGRDVTARGHFATRLVHLAGEPVLIISGQYDPIVPASDSAQLAAVLMNAGATVRTRALPVGPRAVADGSGHEPRLVGSKLREACRRRSKIDHYATENSLIHALRACEFFLERYSDQSQKDRRRVK